MQQEKEKQVFFWTEDGFKQKLYCYYCKALGSEQNKINDGGYGCTNCRNYNENTNQSGKAQE